MRAFFICESFPALNKGAEGRGGGGRGVSFVEIKILLIAIHSHEHLTIKWRQSGEREEGTEGLFCRSRIDFNISLFDIAS